MKLGEFDNGSKTLRAKIDMGHPNMNMRDPVIYRILHAHHHRTKDEWCIYPMYDWAHGLEDSIEGVGAAVNAGISVIGVTSSSSGDILNNAGCIKSISNYQKFDLSTLE